MTQLRRRAFLSVGAVAGVAALGVAAGVLALAGGGAAPAASPASAGAFEIDPVHSVVVYKIKHAKASNHYGLFTNPTGSFLIDADPAKSMIDVTVKADSIYSGNGKRDQHLKSGDFFSVKEFPTIAFKSKSFKSEGAAMTVAGDLTLHGVTKPVTAAVSVTGTNGGMEGTATGLEATFTIKRTDFGMSMYADNGMLGDEVTLIVALEGAPSKGEPK